MRIAFHTPLNLFDDDGVSGDRRMARQLVAALRSLGHEVEPVPAPRFYLRGSDPAELAALQAKAATIRAELTARWRNGPAPDLWFTYHHYYRAPDLLGSGLARAFGIPYVTAEASDAPRRAEGEWAPHTQRVRSALAAGDVHVYFTERDRQGLEPWRRPGTALMRLPPFIAFDTAPPETGRTEREPLRLVTLAMMREGTKQNSYLALARILDRIRHLDWRLSVIGDGSGRATIEAAFAGLPPGRVSWLGLLPREHALTEVAGHDLFVWPGLREAYGLVYLEAQAVGLPVVAFDSGGVPDVVAQDETGLLVPEGDEAAFADALEALLRDPERRERMGRAARRFALADRSPARAAENLAEVLAVAVANRRAKTGQEEGEQLS